MRNLRLCLTMLMGLALVVGVTSAAERFVSTPGGQKATPDLVARDQTGQPVAVQFLPLSGGQNLPQPQWFMRLRPELGADDENESREATPFDNGFVMPLVPQRSFVPSDPKVSSFAQLAQSRGWQRHDINGITYYIMPCGTSTH
jgi:hypothetical protein